MLDRLQAALYDAFGARFERRYGAALRRPHLAAARGRVLEIGAGTGANLGHYPATVDELVLSEPSRAMLRRAERRVAGRPGPAPTLCEASADELPFPDASFDTVVCTLVLCTVPDQAKVLSEVRRVLKPGGRLLFAEHVRAHDPRLAKRQDRWEPIWRRLVNGCHPNRDTEAALRAAGFDVEVDERGELPMVPRLVKPYVVGQAVSR